jgi:cyclohexadienyl dehydratase
MTRPTITCALRKRMSLTAYGRLLVRAQLLLLLLFVLCWAPTRGLAATSEQIRARGFLRVGMSGDYAPFCLCPASEESPGSNEKCTGFEVETARRLAADLGVRLEIVRFRWPELRHDLEADKFDVVMSGVTMRPERLLFATFTRPYAVAGAVVLVADPQRFPVVTAVNHTDVRLAVNAGGHLEQVARSRFTSSTVITTLKNTELPTLVADHQADALLTDSFEAPHFLAEHQSLTALPAFGRDRKAYLVRRTDGEWREWLNKWLTDRERDGFLPTLRQQWLKEPRPQPLPPLTALFALLDLRLAVMPAVADYKQRSSVPVEDLKQESAVIAHAADVGRGQGRNPEAVQELFRVQIDLAKQVQRFVLAAPERIPPWAQGLDLASELRPILVDLGDQMLALLPQFMAPSMTQSAVVQLTEEEILTEGVTREDKQRLGEAVWRVMTK